MRARNAGGQSDAPTPLVDTSQLVCGFAHTCARTSNGSGLCWGHDTYNQSSSITASQNMIDVAAGGSDTCSVTQQGNVECWGRSLGKDGLPAAPLLQYRAVKVSWDFACAVRQYHHDLRCWGDPSLGRTLVVPASICASTFERAL